MKTLEGSAPDPRQRNLGRPPEDPRIQDEFLARSSWPSVEEKWINPEIEAQFETVFEVIRAIRNIRQKNGIALTTRLTVIIRTGDEVTRKHLEKQCLVLERMANIEPPKIGSEYERPKRAGIEVLKNAEVYVTLAGLVDPEKERTRLAKEIEHVRNAVTQSEKKLSNDSFVKNAPPDKVEAERARLQGYRDKIASLEQAMADCN